MYRIILYVIVIFFASFPCYAVDTLVEDFSGPCDGDCGCDAGCGLSNDPYSFVGSCFRSYDGTLNWTSSAHQTTGGVNNSAYFRGVADSPGTGEGCMFFGVSSDINDPTFYYRIARRFSSGFGSGLEAKLHYIYPSGSSSPINNLFLSSGSITLYLNYGGGQWLDNDTNNIVSHANQFVWSDYAGEWWAYAFYMDLSSTTHTYKLWLTTAAGAANCAAGEVCTVSERLEYNNYLYMHGEFEDEARDPGNFQVGHYINAMSEVTDNATTDFDSFAISDSALSSNVFDGGSGTTTFGSGSGSMSIGGGGGAATFR